MNEISNKICDAGEWFPLEVSLLDRDTGQAIDHAGVSIACTMQRRVTAGEVAPASVAVTDWVPAAADGSGVVPGGVLWFSPANLATPGSYDCTLEATKAGGKPWPTRASFRLEVRATVQPSDGEDANGSVFNVMHYGAAGDGISDDSAAVRAALVAGAGRDVKFPAGTYILDPHVNWFAVASGTRLVGDGPASVLKIKGGIGSYTAIFGPLGGDFVTPTSDVTFSDLAFDQNVAGNPAQVTSVGQAYQMAILFYAPTRIKVERCTFNDACGLNTIMLYNDASTGSTIRDCTFRFVKNGAVAYDESAIYLHGTDWEVSGCRFYGTPLTEDAVTAIDCHGGRCRVFDNRIYDYSSGINVVSLGADTRGIQIHGNVVENCNVGISLWSLTGEAITGASIQGNTIALSNATRASLLHAGIQLYDGDAGTIAGSFANVLISGNVIVAQKENRALAQPADCYGIGLRPKGTIADITVIGNTVRNFPSLGCFLYNATSAKRIVVTGNTFTDCGNGTGVPGYYRIGLLFAGEALEHVHVNDNLILDSGPVGSPLGVNSVVYADVTPVVGPSRCTVYRTSQHPSLTFAVSDPGIAVL